MRVPAAAVSALFAVAASLALASSAAASREVVVYLTPGGFAPGTSTVSTGDRVRFTVRDRKAHQIAKTSGPNSGDVAPNVLEGQGSSVTLMPDEVGSYTYVDRLNARRPEFRLVVRALRR
jgi:plastocyanin